MKALACDKNPVDNLAPPSKANILIFAVIGDADEAVPVSENMGLVEARYRELGGKIQVIRKPSGKHHPHSLRDPAPSVEFAVQASVIDLPNPVFMKFRLKDIAAACRKQGVKLGFYYSQNLDWHHPGGGGGEWDPAHTGDADKYMDDIVIPSGEAWPGVRSAEVWDISK